MRCGSALLLCVSWWTLAGCDPTSGFADTADAALPEIKRYFDGRGSRLAEGPWNRVIVDLDPDTLYHVGARRLDDAEPTFHLFGTDVREGCGVSPNAGTWLMGKPRSAPFRVLPFLEEMDERGRGRLRFTTLDCEVQEVEVENAGRPYPRLYDNGYLVPTNRGYTFVDPWTGDQRTIAEDLRTALVWKGASLLWDDGKLKSYGEQFELDKGDVLGDAISAVVSIGDYFLIEDVDGLHRVSFDSATLSLERESILPGACALQSSGFPSLNDQGAWVMLQLPCGSPQPTLLALDDELEPVGEPLTLPVEADSRFARALAPWDGEDPQPIAVLYLTDVADGFGTLWALQVGSEEPIRIGERAELDTVFRESPDSSWDGVAQVNYQTLGTFTAYDWVRFRWDGETAVMAERVVRNSVSGEVLVNFDGVAGDLPLFGDGNVRILAEDLSPSATEATSYVGDRHHARVDHFDGSSGRVVLSATPDDPESWQTLGNGVPPESVRFAWFMPSLIFLENWDSERLTGSLVAYNYELDARATIADGVSSFDLTSYPWDGVIYSVPHGGQRGLWFSKAK